ncbi:MAG: squalene--hopene cyclase [Verrucomicrobiota bacterium]
MSVPPSHRPRTPSSSAGAALPSLPEAVHRAQSNLLRLQNPDGHWAGELIVDSTLCSDYILFMHWAGTVDPVLQEKCVAHIRARQLPDGGWNIYYGGPSEVNATVKACFALRLAGDSPQAAWMERGRAAALRLGGIPRMNTYAKLYLALLGQFPWEKLPTIPVEMALLPHWFPLSLYRLSSWSRAMLVPLSILNHLRPTRHLHPDLQIRDLFPADADEADLMPRPDRRLLSLRNLFLYLDRCLKGLERLGLKPFRRPALRAAVRWMTQRMGAESHGLAAIFPAMLNAIIALKALGYDDAHPTLAKALRDFEGLFVDDPEDFRIQPCLSPVWDTSINLIALVESGMEEGEPISRAAGWLADREVRIRGDWAANNPHPAASGWSFEFRNDYYPDTDDTMMVLLALRFAPPVGSTEALRAIFARALPWLLSFQCRDGGWAAFDKDVTQRWLESVPFADHNAILDPACSDLTGRMLELLGSIGFDPAHPAVRRAVSYLRRTQEPDGSWYGRWGVNYIYGTWQVLRGLRAIGEPMGQEWIMRARFWLESCQNEDGGWGESPASYDDPSLKGRGESTPSQTAWAVMGLCACGDARLPALRRGIEWLLRNQNRDGSWSEPQTTGTGFPRVFYLNYDMYRNNFPLLALAAYARITSGKGQPRSRIQGWSDSSK